MSFPPPPPIDQEALLSYVGVLYSYLIERENVIIGLQRALEELVNERRTGIGGCKLGCGDGASATGGSTSSKERTAKK